MTNHQQKDGAMKNPGNGTENLMKQINVAKVTLNIGAGKNEDVLKKGLKLLQKITGAVPVKTFTSKRIPGWGLRPGLAIGVKVTVRRNAEKLLRRLLAAKDNRLVQSNFDERGNVSFGIPEYIDIEGLEYDPELKIMGLEAAVTLARPGFRVKSRKLRPARIGRKHLISKPEAMAYLSSQGVAIEA